VTAAVPLCYLSRFLPLIKCNSNAQLFVVRFWLFVDVVFVEWKIGSLAYNPHVSACVFFFGGCCNDGAAASAAHIDDVAAVLPLIFAPFVVFLFGFALASHWAGWERF